MQTRQQAIDHCLTLAQSYEDQPFRDSGWTVIRHEQNRKIFAWIFERQGHIWINVKAKPELIDILRQEHESVVPAYHLNKDHWNSIILDGSIPEEDIHDMIYHSYTLTLPRIRKPAKEKK